MCTGGSGWTQVDMRHITLPPGTCVTSVAASHHPNDDIITDHCTMSQCHNPVISHMSFTSMSFDMDSILTTLLENFLNR